MCIHDAKCDIKIEGGRDGGNSGKLLFVHKILSSLNPYPYSEQLIVHFRCFAISLTHSSALHNHNGAVHFLWQYPTYVYNSVSSSSDFIAATFNFFFHSHSHSFSRLYANKYIVVLNFVRVTTVILVISVGRWKKPGIFIDYKKKECLCMYFMPWYTSMLLSIF